MAQVVAPKIITDAGQEFESLEAYREWCDKVEAKKYSTENVYSSTRRRQSSDALQ
jgi:hypothetical protein